MLININYKVVSFLKQQMEVPDNFEIPKSNSEIISKLRSEFPNHEIWTTIPSNDYHGIEITDHLEFIESSDFETEIIDEKLQIKFEVDSFKSRK